MLFCNFIAMQHSCYFIMLSTILIACFIGGVISVVLASLFSATILANHAHRMVAFAVGILLGFAFTDLLPEALHLGINPSAAGWMILAGILLFFMMEKLALWRHQHSFTNNTSSEHAEVSIILLGDGIHNLIDGILLAAAFMTDVKLGWVTTLAITAHEIPQEISDFIVLMHAGLSKTKAIVLNMLSGATMLVGGVVGWVGFSHIEHLIPHALLLAAASFIYIALADLVPSLHRDYQLSDLVIQVSLLLMGLGVAWGSPIVQSSLITLWGNS